VTRYIQASTLKLRAAPSATGKVRGRLAINSPLEVLEEKDGFTRVRVGNGKEGWVGSRFLGEAPVTVEQARERAGKTVAPKERLSWLQRAAALEPTSLEVLGELQAAYELNENKRASLMVEKLMKKLKVVEAASKGTLLATYRDGLEWRHADDEGFIEGLVPRAKWAEHGLIPEAELWALPKDGPAARVEPTALRREVWNECGGDNGLTVDLGAPYVLAHLGKPPGSWARAPTPWSDADRATLEARVRKERCKADWDCQLYTVANKGHGAYVRVLNEREIPDDDMYEFSVVDIRATAPDGALKKVYGLDTQGYILGEPVPVALRDVVGDDAPEVIFQDDCSSSVRTVEGHALFNGAFRCCGC
jgi:hypothetical protein